ncbi:MAG: hypothetical protein ABIQ09_06675, partial [Jatrophihabitantaceae bacterium]
RVRVCGPDDRETLDARYGLAWFTGAAGDPVSARDQFDMLVADRVRVCGPDDRETLDARYGLAWFTGQAGDSMSAVEQSTGLLTELVDRHSDIRDLAKYTIRWNIGRLLSGEAVAQGEPDSPKRQLIANLLAAIAGSAEALVRLPSELVEIVESLRASSEKVGSG